MTASSDKTSHISREQFDAIGRAGVPLADLMDIRTDTLAYGRARLRLPWQPLLARPGGVVSGPALFTLADMTMYALVMSAIGNQEMAVTADISIRYLNPAPACDVLADGGLLRLGRRNAVCEVSLSRADTGALIAHATGNYALPPQVDTDVRKDASP